MLGSTIGRHPHFTLALDQPDPSSVGSDKVAHCRQFAFHVVTPKRTWCLIPEDASELLRWTSKLSDVLADGIIAPALLQSAQALARSGDSESEPDNPVVAERVEGSPSHEPDDAVGASKQDSDDATGDVRADGVRDTRVGAGQRVALDGHSRPNGNANTRGIDAEANTGPSGDGEVVRLRAELEAAQMTIAQLKRTNHELTERLEMRDVDARQVRGVCYCCLA